MSSNRVRGSARDVASYAHGSFSVQSVENTAADTAMSAEGLRLQDAMLSSTGFTTGRNPKFMVQSLSPDKPKRQKPQQRLSMKGFDPTSLREGGDSELNKLVSIRIDGLEGYDDDAFTTSDLKNVLVDPHGRNMANSRTSVTQGIARDTSQKRVNAGNLKQRKDGAVHIN